MRWLLALAVMGCLLAPARARADEHAGGLDAVCEDEPAPPSCEDDSRGVRMAWPISPPAIVDCNDTENPLLADLVGRCDMPELLPKADLQSLEDEPEGPTSPAPGDTCQGSSCSQGDPPLSPRRTQDLTRTWVLPIGPITIGVPRAIALSRWPEPQVTPSHVPFILDRPPRAR